MKGSSLEESGVCIGFIQGLHRALNLHDYGLSQNVKGSSLEESGVCIGFVQGPGGGSAVQAVHHLLCGHQEEAPLGGLHLAGDLGAVLGPQPCSWQGRLLLRQPTRALTRIVRSLFRLLGSSSDSLVQILLILSTWGLSPALGRGDSSSGSLQEPSHASSEAFSDSLVQVQTPWFKYSLFCQPGASALLLAGATPPPAAYKSPHTHRPKPFQTPWFKFRLLGSNTSYSVNLGPQPCSWQGRLLLRQATKALTRIFQRLFRLLGTSTSYSINLGPQPCSWQGQLLLRQRTRALTCMFQSLFRLP